MMRPRRLAFFVTPHGFGHASCAVAVVESLVVHDPQLEFIFITSVPRLKFFSSISRFDHQLLDCDVGLVQRDALTTDLPATLQKLASFLPFDTEFVESLAFQLFDWDCCAVISDIAPLGIEAARVAGLPSILIENFTWDWIYRGYADRYPEMTEHAVPHINLCCSRLTSSMPTSMSTNLGCDSHNTDQSQESGRRRNSSRPARLTAWPQVSFDHHGRHTSSPTLPPGTGSLMERRLFFDCRPDRATFIAGECPTAF